MEPIQSPFEGFTEVADQMPPVKDVLDRWRASCGATRIRRRAATTEDDDARMCPEPRGSWVSRAVGPQVKRPMALPVHQQDAIRTPTTKGPIVHPKDGGCRHGWGWQPADETQQGIEARRHMELGTQPCPGFATERETEVL